MAGFVARCLSARPRHERERGGCTPRPLERLADLSENPVEGREALAVEVADSTTHENLCQARWAAVESNHLLAATHI